MASRFTIAALLSIAAMNNNAKKDPAKALNEAKGDLIIIDEATNLYESRQARRARERREAKTSRTKENPRHD